VAEVCDFLRIEVVTISEPRLMPDVLAGTPPLAVLLEAPVVDCVVYDLMMILAEHARELPTMIVMPDTPQHRGALHTAQNLWQVHPILHVPQRPGIRAMINFLFEAGRRFGRRHALAG
jgi:hypothetical protein